MVWSVVGVIAGVLACRCRWLGGYFDGGDAMHNLFWFWSSVLYPPTFCLPLTLTYALAPHLCTCRNSANPIHGYDVQLPHRKDHDQREFHPIGIRSRAITIPIPIPGTKPSPPVTRCWRGAGFGANFCSAAHCRDGLHARPRKGLIGTLHRHSSDVMVLVQVSIMTPKWLSSMTLF